MLVCLRGHQVTAMLREHPEYGRAFCQGCGAKTISACPKCNAPIPGHLNVPRVANMLPTPVPNRCGSCGEAFPWAVSDEAKTFSEIVSKGFRLSEPKTLISAWSIILRLQGLLNLPVAAAARARCEVTWSLYWTLHELYGAAKPLPRAELENALQHFAGFLRGLEATVKDIQTLLGYPIDDKDLPGYYGELRDGYQALVAEYDAFRVKLGLTPLLWSRAEIYSEIPKRSDIDERVYATGESFGVYSDVKRLVAGAKGEVYIVEPYPSDELFDLYLEKVPDATTIRVLVKAKKYDAAFVAVGKKFKAKPGRKIEVREVPLLHDRTFFVDDRGWTVGQSLKDAAKDKPTYLQELATPEWRKIHDDLWTKGTVIL
jgi:hypothetical protein